MLLGGQIPDPAHFGIDIIFPAAMVGLAVGLVTGRRELVAAIVGAGIAVVVALLTSPSIGIVAGGVLGPAIGLLVPASAARETAPLGTSASAERFSMPGAHVTSRRPTSRPRRSRRPLPRSADELGGIIESRRAGADRRGATVSTSLIVLAVLMFAVTYPTRALGLLTPGLDRLPRGRSTTSSWSGPAVLAALAAVAVMVRSDDDGVPVVPRRDRVGRGRSPASPSSPGGATCSSA